MQKTIIRLPIPISVNALYYNRKGGKGRGRIKTPAYRRWLAEADKWLLMQKRGLKKIEGLCSVLIQVPPTRADVYNLGKAPQDFLVSRELTDDDKFHVKVSLEVVPGLDCCLITIIPLTSEPALG